MSQKTLNKSDLAQFTGSEQWYRHGLVRSILFTDGAKYVADKAGAYWLLDEIAHLVDARTEIDRRVDGNHAVARNALARTGFPRGVGGAVCRD